jgi:aminoglycoside phosphotransferase (APT) family kinase protein
MAASAQATSAIADPGSPWPRGSRRGHLLVALRGIDASNGPAAGPHNFHRGGSLAIYDRETRQSIGMLADEIDVRAVTKVWDTALETSWQGPPVWVHGDIAATNLLVKGAC